MKKLKNILIAVAITLASFAFLSANALAAPFPTVVNTTYTANTTNALLGGEVNPNGLSTTVWYETQSSGHLGTMNIGTGNSSVPLQGYNLTGLSAGTSYTFRIVATNSAGSVTQGPWTTFTTQSNGGGNNAGAPIILSSNFSNVTSTSATFTGSVNPNGSTSNAWYETRSSESLQVQSLNGNSTLVDLSPYTISNLTPNTTYSFRVVSSNVYGVTRGDWKDFTTTSGNTNPTYNYPVLNSISPNSGEMGDTLNVTLYGNYFTSNTNVYFGNGINVNSVNVINSNQITAQIYISNSSYTGTRSVYVSNSYGNSNSVSFSVIDSGSHHYDTCDNNDEPTIDYVTPETIDYNSSSRYITIYGDNFTHDSVARWNGSSRPTNYINSGRLSMYIYSNDTEDEGNNYVTVYDQDCGISNSERVYIEDNSNNNDYYYPNNYNYYPSNYYQNYNYNRSTVSTQAATSKTTSEARLNGIATINSLNSNNRVYFEYGPTSLLGYRTAAQSLGNVNYTVSFSDAITGLSSNTTYYFRAVLEDGSNKYYGSIFLFQTLRVTVVGNLEFDTQPKIVKITDQSDLLRIRTTKRDLIQNEDVSYIVNYENTTGKTLENVRIDVQLPEEIVFDSADFGNINKENNLSVSIGTLIPNQKGEIFLRGHVSKNTGKIRTVVTTATITYTEGRSNEKNESAYTTNDISTDGSLTAASIFGDGSFLPSTLIGWLLLIVAILGLVILGRSLYTKAKIS